MAISRVCCTCLAINVETFSLCGDYNDDIKELFEKNIPDIKIDLGYRLLQHVCEKCVLIIRKFVEFKDKCLKANQLLREMLSQHTYIFGALLTEAKKTLYSETANNFGDNPLNLDSKFSVVQIKQEAFCDRSSAQIDLDQAMLVDSFESQTDLKMYSVDADEEDEFDSDVEDKPLKMHEDMKESRNVIKRSRKDECRSSIKKNTLLVKKQALWKSNFAVQISLTKEQQIEEFLKRDISDNYLKAAFKCKICFTGFPSEEKFAQHMDLHNENCGEWECDLCKLRFGNTNRLRFHKQSHSNRYKCLTCGELTKSRTQAKLHSNKHMDIVLYECKLCATQFQQYPLYARHIRTAHPTDYACHSCGDYFPTQYFLQKHMNTKRDCTKLPKNIIQCELCDRRFIKLGNSWYSHMLGHSREKERDPPSDCQICGHETPSWSDWSYHFCSQHRNKNSDKAKTIDKEATTKFVCDICGRTLSAKCKLVQHIRTQHTDGTPYNKYNWRDTCQVCSKLILRTNMKRHLSTHTGEKPFKCDVCEKCFTQAFSRDEHARTIHKSIDAYPLVKRRKKNSSEQSCDANGKPLNFACRLCPKRFKGRQNLTLHERTHTGEKPFSCDLCQRSYVSKHTLEVHRMTHTGEKPYPCHICDERFIYKSSLQNHIKDHTGETPFVCDICNRGFKVKNNLKRHELVHTGVKNHACDLCGKTFMHHGSLKLHVRTVHLNLPHPPRKPRKRNINK